MESKKCVKLGFRILLLLSVLSPLVANPLKGKFHPIGPGTDAGLYNEGFFEGDIVPRMDVSIDNAARAGFEFHLLLRIGGDQVYRTRRLWWSSGYHVGLWYPRLRVRTRPKLSDFSGEKIHNMPSFRGEVKPSVLCRRFAAC
jgi:hypothetical protein